MELIEPTIIVYLSVNDTLNPVGDMCFAGKEIVKISFKAYNG